MKISVYIPCYNSEKTIQECIYSLKHQILNPDEIIVINDGSTDKTEEIAKKLKVKVVNHKENLGIAEARNTGLKSCKNNIVAGIDSDAIADKYWLKNLYSAFKKEKAVLVGGKIDEKINSFADRWRAQHLNQSWGEKKVENPDYIAGNNFICDKKELLNIDGYNPEYKTNYEDVDISKRLKEKKKKIIYEPEAVVSHNITDTIKSVLDRHWRYMLHDYPLPNNIWNKIIKIPINIYTGFKFWLGDSFTKAELIFIDIRLIFHHIKKDFQYRK